MASFDLLQKRINYRFSDLNHLQEALSHPSLKQHKKQPKQIIIDNERYEILGDTIIALIVVELLLEQFPHWPEGKIAKLKAHIVSTEILSNIAKEINLGKYIIMTSGEEATGGRQNPANLENAFEALIAAIYLDSKQTLTACRKLLRSQLMGHISSTDLSQIDPKTALQEYAQQFKQQVIYRRISMQGAAHSPIFEIEAKLGQHAARGKASTVKAAEKSAARILLANIKIRDNK